MSRDISLYNTAVHYCILGGDGSRCDCPRQHPNKPRFADSDCISFYNCYHPSCYYKHVPGWNPMRIDNMCPTNCKASTCPYIHDPTKQTHRMSRRGTFTLVRGQKMCKFGRRCRSLIVNSDEICGYSHGILQECKFGDGCKYGPSRCYYMHNSN